MAEYTPAYPEKFDKRLAAAYKQLERIANALEKLASCVKDGELQVRHLRPPDVV